MIYRYIYKITCTNGSFKDHFYYGQHTTKNLNDGYKGSGRKIGDYYKKYPNDYIKEIISYHNTKEDLDIAETNIIQQYIDDPYCLNVLSTGFAHYQKEHSKQSISDKAKERWSNSDYREHMSDILKVSMNKPEVRQKLSINAKRSHNTKEYKQKTSELLMGHTVTEETKKKLSEKAKQQWSDPEFKRKYSEKLKGRIPWNKGLKLSKSNC